MEFQTRKEANATIVTITGRLDAVTTPDYEKRVRALIEGGDNCFVVDFGQLDYISSAGLRGLLVTAKLLKASGGTIRFANVGGNVRSVFDMSGFVSMFPIDDSVAAAVGALA
jgi:stage II sporulation protein AA (anti-sigma F factor antagonist)